MSPFWLIRARAHTNKRPQYAKQLSSSTARKWRRLIIAHNEMRLEIYYSPQLLVHLDAERERQRQRKGDKTGCRIYIKGALVNLNPTLDEKQNNADHYSPLSTAELNTEKEKTRRTTERPASVYARTNPVFLYFLCVCVLSARYNIYCWILEESGLLCCGVRKD